MAVEDEQQSKHGGICGSRGSFLPRVGPAVTQAGSLGPPGQAAHVLLVGAEREFFSFTPGLK